MGRTIQTVRPDLFAQSAPIGNGPLSYLWNAVNKSHLDDDGAWLFRVVKMVAWQEAAIVDAERISDPVKNGLHAIGEIDPIPATVWRVEVDSDPNVTVERDADVCVVGRNHSPLAPLLCDGGLTVPVALGVT